MKKAAHSVSVERSVLIIEERFEKLIWWKALEQRTATSMSRRYWHEIVDDTIEGKLGNNNRKAPIAWRFVHVSNGAKLKNYFKLFRRKMEQKVLTCYLNSVRLSGKRQKQQNKRESSLEILCWNWVTGTRQCRGKLNDFDYYKYNYFEETYSLSYVLLELILEIVRNSKTTAAYFTFQSNFIFIQKLPWIKRHKITSRLKRSSG